MGCVGLNGCVIDCVIGALDAIPILNELPVTGMVPTTVSVCVEIIEAKADVEFDCHKNDPSGVTAEPYGFVPTGTVFVTVFVARLITAVAAPKYSLTNAVDPSGDNVIASGPFGTGIVWLTVSVAVLITETNSDVVHAT